MESTKKYGVCRDANNKLIGKYVYLEKEDDQYLVTLCKSWLETYRQNTNFFLTIDLETQSLDYINDTILLYSISWNGKQAVVFSPHFMWGLFSSKGQGESWDLFLEVLKTIPINNQNIKFDAKWWLSQYGILVNIIFDPMIAAQLCYAGGFPGNRFSLDNLAKYLLYPMEISKGFQTSFIGQPVTQRCTFDQIHYAANDSLVTHRLVEPLVTRLKTNELWDLWEEVELPLLSSLIVSEVKGVKIDVPSVKTEYEKAKEVHLEIGKQLQLEYQKIPEETRPQFPGNEFNPNSPKQIEQILNSVGIRVPKTSKDALSDALVKHPDCNIIKHILDSKKIQNGTLKYFKAWLEEHINPTTGCIHPNFKSNGTDTGRMASSDPNMQNIPPHLRHLIIARDGYDIITSDYCYDDQTEVLTNEGWKLFSDLNQNELFYSLSPETHDIELVPANRYICNDYSGEMVSTESQAISLLVTPNHKHYVNTHWNKKRDNWQTLTAKECLTTNRISMKKNGNPISNGPTPTITVADTLFTMEDWLFFLGYYLADGHNNQSDGRIFISDGSIDNLNWLKGVLDPYFKTFIKKGATCYLLWFKDKKLAEYLRNFGHSDTKYIPEQLWSVDSRYLQHLFDGLMLGDGTNKKVNNQYTTISKQLADDVQRLCLHLGFSATITSIDREDRSFNGYISTVQRVYCVSINKSKNEPKVKHTKQDAFSVCEYTGKVYCVTLERNHLLYVRRKGKAVWSQNSQFEFRAAAAYTMEQYLIDTYNERAELLPLVIEEGKKFGEPDPDHFVKEAKKGKYELTKGQKELVDRFAGTDIHRRNASLVLNLPIDQITDKHRSLGKAQPLYSKILTPTGFKLMGDIKVGDKVSNPDGSVATVIGVYPQGNKDCYRISFRNGQQVDACSEHLWNVLTYENQKLITKTVDTNWISKNIKRNQKDRYNESNIFIETPAPLYGEKTILPIDPYLLGCWLGDGTVTLGRDCAITVGDNELLERIRESIDDGLTLRLTTSYDKRTPSYRITRKNAPGSRQIPSFFERINNLGLGLSKSYSKFVPNVYLNSDIESRLSILQGLLDTDGTIDKKGSITFSSCSQELSNNVVNLVRSLGGKASTFTKKIKGYRDAFIVYLFLPNNLPPFKLSRKLERVKSKKDRFFKTSVSSVEFIGKQVCQCIMVDNPNHLYVTDDYIVTHNTLGYALLYGAGPRRMLDQLIVSGFYDTTLADCNMYGQTFMKQLPKVSAFITEIHERVLDPGYIETFMGRKRFFPLPPPYQTRYYEQKLEDAKRAAVNAVFQSSNADATKLSMVVGGQVLERAFENDIPLMLLNVHDEIVTEAKKDYSPKASEIVVNVMTESGERSLDYKVPIEVSMSIGSAWKK